MSLSPSLSLNEWVSEWWCVYKQTSPLLMAKEFYFTTYSLRLSLYLHVSICVFCHCLTTIVLVPTPPPPSPLDATTYLSCAHAHPSPLPMPSILEIKIYNCLLLPQTNCSLAPTPCSKMIVNLLSPSRGREQERLARRIVTNKLMLSWSFQLLSKHESSCQKLVNICFLLRHRADSLIPS